MLIMSGIPEVRKLSKLLVESDVLPFPEKWFAFQSWEQAAQGSDGPCLGRSGPSSTGGGHQPSGKKVPSGTGDVQDGRRRHADVKNAH